MRLEARSVALVVIAALVVLESGCSTQSSGPEASSAGKAADGSGGSAGVTGAGSGGVAGASSGRGGAAGDAVSGGRNGRGGRSGGGAAGASGRGGAAGGSAGAESAGDGGSAGDGTSGSAGAAGQTADAVTVYYLDVGGSVMATDVEQPAARTIVEDAGQGPDGIALDEEHGHLYWTGMGVPSEDDGFIRRADLDGSNIVTIVPEGGTYTPKQLKIDHEHQKLYWSDREGMRVMRANLDGSELETLVTTGSGASDRADNSRWCVGIALDLASGYVYWSQKGPDNGMVGSLRRAPLTLPAGENSTNRSDIELLFSGLPEPIDIDLDLAHGHIYWTDRGDDTINRAPIEIPDGETAATRSDREVLVDGVREAIGVTLDVEHGKLYFTGGTAGRVGTANLDGSGLTDLLTGSAGLTGIALLLR